MNTFSEATLIDAVKKSHLGKLKQAYNLGTDLSFQNHILLKTAIKYGQAMSLDFLITRCKLDPNACDGALLAYACSQGTLDCVYVLCKRGANINARKGQALIQAMKEKKYHIVETLVKRYGADPSLNHSEAALIAVGNNDYKMAELCFLQAGKRCAFVNFEMFSIVCMNGNTQMFDLLRRRYQAQSSGIIIRNSEYRGTKELKVWDVLLEYATEHLSYGVAHKIMSWKETDWKGILSTAEMSRVLKFTAKGSEFHTALKKEINNRALANTTFKRKATFVK